jgi:hypothetical protein
MMILDNNNMYMTSEKLRMVTTNFWYLIWYAIYFG